MTWRAAALLALTLGAYAVIYDDSILRAGFVYEDAHWLDSQEACCRTLTLASMRAQAGSSPAAYHAVNLALHLAAGALGWAWLRRVGLSASAAGFGAAALLLHPLATESAAYIAARGELIAALFTLAASALAMASGPIAIGAGILALGAGLGKTSGLVALPLVALTFWLKRRPIAGTISIGLALAIGLVAFRGFVGQLLTDPVAAAEPGGLIPYGSFLSAADPVAWLRFQAVAATRLLGMLPLPLGQTVDFDVEAVPAAMQLVALAQLAMLGATAIVLWRVDRQAAFGLTWILTALAPRLVVQTPGSFLNEHHVFLAMPGAALIGAALWDRFSPERCHERRSAERPVRSCWRRAFAAE